MNEEIKKLIELNNELKQISEKKIETVRSQKYEKAAALRDKERNIIVEIEKTAGLENIRFENEKISRKVIKDFHKVLDFIESGDNNLTPALLRKLSKDVKVAEANEGITKGRLTDALNREEALKIQMRWIHILDERPKVIESGSDGKLHWRQSEEVMVLYVREDGTYDICMGVYIEEDKGVHDKVYYFAVKNDLEGIEMNRVKGWMPLPDKKFRNISVL